jgi:hypothetical protein
MEPVTIIIGAGVAAGAAYFAKNRKASAAKSAAATSDIQKRVVAALTTGDPDVCDATAAQLLKEGPDGERAAVSLSALAAQWRKASAVQQSALDAMAKMGVKADTSAGNPAKLTPVPSPVAEKPSGKLDPSETVRATAAQLLTELQGKAAGKENRKLVALFQEQANAAKWVPALKVDGLYGEGARAALRYYTGKEAPAPLYGAAKGQAYKPVSASEGGKVDDRYFQGQAVVAVVTGKTKANYPSNAKPVVAKFQTMLGLPADGLYGKNVAAALRSVGIANPPAPIF